MYTTTLNSILFGHMLTFGVDEVGWAGSTHSRFLIAHPLSIIPRYKPQKRLLSGTCQQCEARVESLCRMAVVDFWWKTHSPTFWTCPLLVIIVAGWFMDIEVFFNVSRRLGDVVIQQLFSCISSASFICLPSSNQENAVKYFVKMSSLWTILRIQIRISQDW